MSNSPCYLRPATIEQLWPLRQRHPAGRLVAGGTDLMVRMTAREQRPGVVLSLRRIATLRGISEEHGTTCIGATTTIAELIRHPWLGRRHALLVEAARALGSPQIRNVATIGGNLCNASPCADTAPPLLVLGGQVRLLGPGGRRELPLEQFFCGPGETCLAPDEILEAVLLPQMHSAGGGAFLKKRRVRMDLALASVAVQLQLQQQTVSRVRVAAGSVAPVPLRLRQVEQLLEGQQIGEELLGQAAALARREIDPITDLRTTEHYRRQIIGVYVKRAVSRAAQLAAGGAA